MRQSAFDQRNANQIFLRRFDGFLDRGRNLASFARAESDVARALAALSEEKVKTVRETEVATRRKAIDVLMAEKAAAESRLNAEAAAIRHAVEAEAHLACEAGGRFFV